MYGLWHPNRIAWKLIKALLLFSSVAALVATGVQLWAEYGRDMDAIQSRFVQVERSYLDSIAENVWESDAGRLDLLVNGIIEFPDFKYATVREKNGNTLASVGEVGDERVIRNIYPLHYTFRGANLKIGELEIVVSLTAVYDRIADRVWLILISNAIKTFLVAIFMFVMVYWLLTRHLDVMAAFARRLDFSLPEESLDLDRGTLSGKRDELDQLAESLNHMQTKLFNSYEELRSLYNDLEDRVLERTKALSHEVNRHKRTEKKLADSEARLLDMAESGSDWLWEMGPDLRFTYVSVGGMRTTAVNPSQVIGRTRRELAVETGNVEKWKDHLADLEAHRPFRDFIYETRGEFGALVFLKVSGKPVFSTEGTFLGYRGVGSNVTPQIEAERKAASAETQLYVLSSAMEQNPSMVFITGHDGIIQYVNAKFTEVTGYSSDEVLGKNPRLLKSEDTPASVHKELWKNLKSGYEWRGEIKDRCKDGRSFWAYAVIAPVKNEAGEITHYVATHEDITARKEADVQLHEATERAELASRTKSELMANMSHELRTPLNAIIGFSDSMRSGVFGPLQNERYEDYVNDIHNSGQHLLELINDILDVSAVEAGKLDLQSEPVDVNTVISACLKLVHHRAQSAQVKLSHHIEKGIPDLLCDERRLKQVLLNLLSNAVKFTPENGRVTLNVLRASDGGLRFEVEDTGIGMDEQGIETALMQFGQVDSKLSRRYDGTGLGLPLSESLVELHRGTLDIRSRLGHGTTVVAHFPPERSIDKGAKSVGVKSPDPDAEGERRTAAPGDHSDKKIPTVH